MMAIYMSLGGQPLVNPCLQGHDKVHNPEPLRGDRGNRAKPGPGLNPLKGGYSPNRSALEGGDEVRIAYEKIYDKLYLIILKGLKILSIKLYGSEIQGNM